MGKHVDNCEFAKRGGRVKRCVEKMTSSGHLEFLLG